MLAHPDRSHSETSHLHLPLCLKDPALCGGSSQVHCTPQVTPLTPQRAATRALGAPVWPPLRGSYLRGRAALLARAARGERRGGQPRGSELARSGSGAAAGGGGEKEGKGRAKGGGGESWGRRKDWAERSEPGGRARCAAGSAPLPPRAPARPSQSLTLSSQTRRNSRQKMARLACDVWDLNRPWWCSSLPGNFSCPAEWKTALLESLRASWEIA